MTTPPDPWPAVADYAKTVGNLRKEIATLRARAEAAERRVGVLSEAARLSAIQFREYERQHLAKSTPEADAKAYTNHQMATMCETALASGSADKGGEG